MIKLKDLLKESFTWENRKSGDRLPTLEDYKKLKEQKDYTIALARAYHVAMDQQDYDELGRKVDRNKFKKYFHIPRDADEDPNYKRDPKFNIKKLTQIKEASPNEFTPQISKVLDKAYNKLHDALQRAHMAIKQSGDRNALKAFRECRDELDRFYPLLEEVKSVNEGTNYIGPFVFSDKTNREELLDIVLQAVDGYAHHQKTMQYKKSDYKKAYQEAEKILKKVHGMSSIEIDRETRNR